MSKDKPIIVDANVLFSALLRSQSVFAEVLLGPQYNFYVCELTFVELFKKKEKIIRLVQLSEEEVVRFYYMLLKRLNLLKEDLIRQEVWEKAYELCKDVDETDTPYVALTLQLNGLLWAGDKKLKEGLLSKGFNDFFEPGR